MIIEPQPIHVPNYSGDHRTTGGPRVAAGRHRSGDRRRPRFGRAATLTAAFCGVVTAGAGLASQIAPVHAVASPVPSSRVVARPAPAIGAGPIVALPIRPTLDQSTKDNALAAMHGEAFAHASYHAYAQQAMRTGYEGLALLFTTTAHTERFDHFAKEAALIGFGGSATDNLRTAIAGETYESTTMYPGFARQARLDGCDAAAELFDEISLDEARHAQTFAEALDVLRNPGSGRVVPVGEVVMPVPVPMSLPACTGQTATNLMTAMKGEAFANASYTWYAEAARRAGLPRVARLFINTAGAELGEHFAEEAALAGLVRSNAANLRTAIAGERYEARTMYPSYARMAMSVGDLRASMLFREIARDEAGHASAYTRALRQLSTGRLTRS